MTAASAARGPGGGIVTFGALLGRLRRERGLTQQRLADRAFIGRGHLATLERGRSTNGGASPATIPTRETVASLASALDLDGAETARLLIAAGYWPWRMPEAAIGAFVDAVEAARRTIPHGRKPAPRLARQRRQRPRVPPSAWSSSRRLWLVGRRALIVFQGAGPD